MIKVTSKMLHLDGYFVPLKNGTLNFHDRLLLAPSGKFSILDIKGLDTGSRAVIVVEACFVIKHWAETVFWGVCDREACSP